MEGPHDSIATGCCDYDPSVTAVPAPSHLAVVQTPLNWCTSKIHCLQQQMALAQTKVVHGLLPWYGGDAELVLLNATDDLIRGSNDCREGLSVSTLLCEPFALRQRLPLIIQTQKLRKFLRYRAHQTASRRA